MTTEPTAADAQVGEVRSAIYEVLAALPARDAGRLRSLISELEGAVESAALLRRMADEAQPAERRCTCSHPADEHSIYGCADDCACEWMPKRKPPMDPVRILGIKAAEAQPGTEAARLPDCPSDCPCRRVCIGRDRHTAVEAQQDGTQR